MMARYPTEERIRTALISRAERYCSKHNIGLSVLSKRLVNDPAWLTRVRGGQSFQVTTYQRAMSMLDLLETEASLARRQRRDRIKDSTTEPDLDGRAT